MATKSKKRLADAVDISATKRMRTMWETRQFSDVTVKCNDKSWHLHKCVLAAGSPVIARMLESGMREASDGVINIKDVDSNVCGIFLKFLYLHELGFAQHTAPPAPPKTRGLQTAFQFYVRAMRTQLAPQLAGMPLGEQAKKFTRDWEELSQDDRTSYESQAMEANKTTYEERALEYSRSVVEQTNNVTSVLQLATMYEVHDLVRACCSYLLSHSLDRQEDVSWVIPVIRALRPLQDQAPFDKLWSTFHEYVSKSPSAFAFICNHV